MDTPSQRRRRAARLSVAFLALLSVLFSSSSASAWGNGGKSTDSMNLDYGAHDWIAEHAARMLPENESYFILDNRARFLYATEIPDFVYQDQRDHHVYFHPNGTVMEDNSAAKAEGVYTELVAALRSSDHLFAAEKAGVLTHYISDLAVFGHVLSSKTVWGEEKHHSDFESDVDAMMKSHGSAVFTAAFDGSLEPRGPWEAAVELARNTTFGDGLRTARWLDDNYAAGGVASWAAEYKARNEALIGLAANLIADVLHSAAVEAGLPPRPPVPRPTADPTTLYLILVGLAAAAVILAALQFKRRR